MKVKRKSDGAELHAEQWQPGLDHPAVTREHPPSRGSLGGSAAIRNAVGGFGPAHPGDWLVSETPDAQRACVVPMDQFEEEYDTDEGTEPRLFCPVCVDGSCRGDSCAWWHGASGRCAMLACVALCERG